MENINDLTENESILGEDTFPCPKCGRPQNYFNDSGHGWIRCPECDVGIQKKKIPEEYHKMFRKREEKPEEEASVPIQKTVTAPVARVKAAPAVQQPSEREELFDRPQEDWEILGQVLKEFRVPETVANYIVKRAKRSGSMDPNELSRALSDLKSKLTVKEITYVTEEYYEAITAERERRREDSSYRPYPSFGSTESSSSQFPWRRGQQPTGVQDRNLPSWERDKRARDDSLTPADFERMWSERVDKVESKRNIDGLKETINNMGNMISQLEQRLENPPKVDDSDKFYKMFIDQERKSNDQMLTLMKEMQESRDVHNKQLIELYKTQASQKSTEGYKQDNVRLVADAIQSATTVIQTNKPLHTAVKTLAQSQVPANPPPGEEVTLVEGGDVGILSRVKKVRSDIVVSE